MSAGQLEAFETSGASPPLPLAKAAIRLRGRPGRPRKHPETRHGHVTVTSQVSVASKPEPRAEARQARAPSIGPRLLDVEDAARYLSVSSDTVRDLLARGALSRIELPGVRRVLVDIADIERLIESARRS